MYNEQIATVTAYRNNWPPSFWTSIPRMAKCIPMAPAIKPNANPAPNQAVTVTKSKPDAISSITPVPIRPQGSIPTVVNMYTDSGDAENLKYKV